MTKDDQAAAIAEQNRRKLQEHLKKLAEGSGQDPDKGEYDAALERGAFRKALFAEDASGAAGDAGRLRAEWEAWKRYHRVGSKVHEIKAPEVRSAQDDFKLLGVSPDSNPTEIRKAFYRLAKTAHPDAGGDAARFQQLLEAYERLSAPPAPAGT
ncbi:MAG: J domain-containing protein [Candidatus Lambdaproteobacteria bacterium]|nr:J domain-containing protein [Candidatus Lambdaproteobacteria bacterium]